MKILLIIFTLVSLIVILSSLIITIKDAINDFKPK